MPVAQLSAATREYLCIEPFLRDFLCVQALTAALRLGWIDALAKTPSVAVATLIGEPRGARLLINLLVAHDIVVEHGSALTLTPEFRRVLPFLDLLEAKIAFANLAAGDFLRLFPALVADSRQFQQRSAMYQLFAYDRAWEITPENIQATEQWMQLTTTLTRYEASAVDEMYDFTAHRHLLDIGGNSGEFAAQLCGSHPALRATVLDLPVVCHVGRAHLAGNLAGTRVDFQPGNALEAELPKDCDLITFKSMLHDWPEEEAVTFLQCASEALKPGGTILIFERDQIDAARGELPFGSLPLVAFAASYRGPELYAAALREFGLEEPQLKTVELDLPFFLLTARKPKAAK